MDQEIALAFAECYYCVTISVILLVIGIALFMYGLRLPWHSGVAPGFFVFGSFICVFGVIALGINSYQLTRLYAAPELAIKKLVR